MLKDYLNPRGIKEVLPTALLTLPPEYNYNVASHDPGWVSPIRDINGIFQGICVVWLSLDLTTKRADEPKKQTYGLLKSNFIQCTELDFKNPPPKLCIAEGPETALAMAQLTWLPTIAVGGKGFFKDVILPDCAEYIIAPDCSDDGDSRKCVGELAVRLVGKIVRIAMPIKPEGGKSGYDWNDALLDAGDDEDKLAEHARENLEAPLFESVMTPQEKREIILNALAATKQDDVLSYEQDRGSKAKELGIRTRVLDAEVDRRILKLQPQQSDPPPPNMELLAASAREIIASKDVLSMFAEEFRKFVVGKTKNAKILYLVGTSRLFSKTMHAAVKGPFSGGKSEL